MHTEINSHMSASLLDASVSGPEPETAVFSLFGPILVSIDMALRGLSAVLTMLGVIIGVGAVIIAIAIGQGSKGAVTAAIQRLGTNVLTVRSGSLNHGCIGFGAGSAQTLVPNDAKAILKECPLVLRVSPEVMQGGQVKYENQNTNVTVYGTGESYPQIGNHPVQYGRFFTAEEIDTLQRVAVIRSKTAKDLFGSMPVSANPYASAPRALMLSGF